MADHNSSYRQILKATSIFGGVQIVQIIVHILRSKFLAVLLGPVGVGINSLFNSTIQLIQRFTNFGLQTSAVKNVAEANATGNENRISVIVTVLRRWVWITGFIGVLITIVLSPWLSELTFGNRDYTIAYIWISLSLLFNQLSAGQLVILQGLRKINFLAKANLSGALLGLVISVPIYYLFGVDGIVPAIITVSIANMIQSWYFANKIKFNPIEVSRKTTISEGKQMLTMGFLLSLSGLLTTGGAYLLRIFISNKGGVDQVGLYSAGFAIINTYVGMIFTALGTDYYPRLAAVASDNIKASNTVNQQAEITILVLAPILLLFMVFIKWAVIILYSTKFIAINGMIQWAALGMYFKAATWSIGFILLAKGASKLFFWNELFVNIYMLGLGVLGYKWGGLDGVGISFLVTYVLYLTQILLVSHMKYKITFNNTFIIIFIIQLFLGLITFLIVYFLSTPVSYYIGSVFIIISSLYSFFELNKRIDFRNLFSKFRK